MIFRSRKHRSISPRASVSHTRPEDTSKTQHFPTRQYETQILDWRRSAQQVSRAWYAWQAANAGERGARYEAFVAALADEERAATEVERTVRQTI